MQTWEAHFEEGKQRQMAARKDIDECRARWLEAQDPEGQIARDLGAAKAKRIAARIEARIELLEARADGLVDPPPTEPSAKRPRAANLNNASLASLSSVIGVASARRVTASMVKGGAFHLYKSVIERVPTLGARKLRALKKAFPRCEDCWCPIAPSVPGAGKAVHVHAAEPLCEAHARYLRASPSPTLVLECNDGFKRRFKVKAEERYADVRPPGELRLPYGSVGCRARRAIVTVLLARTPLVADYP